MFVPSRRTKIILVSVWFAALACTVCLPTAAVCSPETKPRLTLKTIQLHVQGSMPHALDHLSNFIRLARNGRARPGGTQPGTTLPSLKPIPLPSIPEGLNTPLVMPDLPPPEIDRDPITRSVVVPIPPPKVRKARPGCKRWEQVESPWCKSDEYYDLRCWTCTKW